MNNILFKNSKETKAIMKYRYTGFISWGGLNLNTYILQNILYCNICFFEHDLIDLREIPTIHNSIMTSIANKLNFKR